MAKPCLRASSGAGSASPSALISLFKAVFIFAALSRCFPAPNGAAFGAAASGAFSLSGMTSSGVYTRTTSRSLVISENGRLIIEESDSFLRPTRRTEWKDGEEYAVTVWEYSGEGMYPCVRVTNSVEGTSRVVFDASGMESESSLFSSAGELLSRSQMEYAPAPAEQGGQNLVLSVTETHVPEEESVSAEQRVYAYNEDGSVKSCTIYQNGDIVKIIQYMEGNSRTETVFYEGVAIYTAEYRDGVRVRPGRSGIGAAAEAR